MAHQGGHGNRGGGGGVDWSKLLAGLAALVKDAQDKSRTQRRRDEKTGGERDPNPINDIAADIMDRLGRAAEAFISQPESKHIEDKASPTTDQPSDELEDCEECDHTTEEMVAETPAGQREPKRTDDPFANIRDRLPVDPDDLPKVPMPGKGQRIEDVMPEPPPELAAVEQRTSEPEPEKVDQEPEPAELETIEHQTSEPEPARIEPDEGVDTPKPQVPVFGTEDTVDADSSGSMFSLEPDKPATMLDVDASSLGDETNESVRKKVSERLESDKTETGGGTTDHNRPQPTKADQSRPKTDDKADQRRPEADQRRPEADQRRPEAEVEKPDEDDDAPKARGEAQADARAAKKFENRSDEFQLSRSGADPFMQSNRGGGGISDEILQAILGELKEMNQKLESASGEVKLGSA